MKLLIAGSRNFTDYRLLSDSVAQVLSDVTEPVTVISGTAKGADTLGERYAEEHGLEVVRMPADWDKHGKAAGFIRNKDMSKVATHAIIFWDGQSKGTKSMILLCKQGGVPVRVIATDLHPFQAFYDLPKPKHPVPSSLGIVRKNY